MNKILKLILLNLKNVFWILVFMSGICYMLVYTYNSYKMLKNEVKQIELPGWFKRTKYADKTLPKVIDGQR